MRTFRTILALLAALTAAGGFFALAVVLFHASLTTPVAAWPAAVVPAALGCACIYAAGRSFVAVLKALLP